MIKFAIGVSRWPLFLASPYRTFFLYVEYEYPKEHESRNTKRTLYLRHRKNELRKNKSGHACSQRAQLIGVTLDRMRGQILDRNLIVSEAQK